MNGKWLWLIGAAGLAYFLYQKGGLAIAGLCPTGYEVSSGGLMPGCRSSEYLYGATHLNTLPPQPTTSSPLPFPYSWGWNGQKWEQVKEML